MGKNTVTDIDGNIYLYAKIGDQEWFLENLKTTRYRNGDIIGTTRTATKDISEEKNPKYQWAYDGNENNVTQLGRLYTWFAVADQRNIAPIGWRVPSNDDWIILEEYLIAQGFNFDGTCRNNKIAKSLASNIGWLFDSTIGTIGNNLSFNNKTGFNGQPSGGRMDDGDFGLIGERSFWWSTTDWNIYFALIRELAYDSDLLEAFDLGRSNGFSVRCMRD